MYTVTPPLFSHTQTQSPQENHHLAAAFKLLQRPELDIFAGVVDKGERDRFRKVGTTKLARKLCSPTR